jgi:hypothetical protein
MNKPTPAEALFSFVAFLLFMGVIGYGLWTHNWSLVIGVLCGAFASTINSAIKSHRNEL